VNRNFLLAISLILLTLFFFNSPFYRVKILGQRPAPIMPQNASNQEKQKSAEFLKNNEKQESIKETADNEKKEKSISKDSSRITQLTGDTIWIENEKIICGISEIGAKIVSLQLKDYLFASGISDKSPKKRFDLVTPESVGGANLIINGEDFDQRKFVCETQDKKIKIEKNDKKEMDFIVKGKGNEEIIKKFSFDGDSYKIGVDISSNGLSGKEVGLGWKCGVEESENQVTSKMGGASEPRKVHIYNFSSNEIEHIQLGKKDREEIEKTGSYKWVAITSKYFMIAIVGNESDGKINIKPFIDSTISSSIKSGVYAQNYEVIMRRSCETNRESYWIFAGPSKLLLLKKYKENFQKVLFGVAGGFWSWTNSWFPPICEWTLWLLIFLFGVLKDYGITIIAITIITRVITYPLSQSSMKSMSRMKELQPKINHIRERYKTNPKKMNEEVMALYKQEGINPFNPGCLPMFLQMPILFALFIVLRKAIELRGAHTVLIPWVKDLSQPESLVSLANIIPNGIPMYGNNIALMPIIMAILTFVQNKMTIKDPNQKMMIYFMPIFMLVLFNNFPAGLVLYWTFSNALGILQQYLLDKSIKNNAPIAPAQILPIKGKSGKRK